ncbi:MAG: hypothetical protein DMF86_06940 [Acidobacteria bacterium]|nr:MAG: hypothetical protein DMF86_06940 [Acidobacteriota bacterium]
MNILGIYDGHLSTAALMIDGRLSAIISEERLTRRKNVGGPPANAIRWLLQQAGLRGDQIDAVALAMITEPLVRWDDDPHQVRRKIFRAVNFLVPGRIVASRHLVKPYVAVYRHVRDWKGLNAALIDNGISPSRYKSHRIEHHEAHAATAYFFAPFREHDKPMLVVTVDGSGDGLSATASALDRQLPLNRRDVHPRDRAPRHEAPRGRVQGHGPRAVRAAGARRTIARDLPDVLPVARRRPDVPQRLEAVGSRTT